MNAIDNSKMQKDDITLGELMSILSGAKDSPLVFYYDGRPVKPSYHVTEVKAGQFSALDCGANPEAWSEIFIQLWDIEEDDRTHMPSGKFHAIIRKVTEHVKLDDSAKLTFEVSDGVQPMQLFARQCRPFAPAPSMSSLHHARRAASRAIGGSPNKANRPPAALRPAPPSAAAERPPCERSADFRGRLAQRQSRGTRRPPADCCSDTRKQEDIGDSSFRPLQSASPRIISRLHLKTDLRLVSTLVEPRSSSQDKGAPRRVERPFDSGRWAGGPHHQATLVTVLARCGRCLLSPNVEWLGYRTVRHCHFRISRYPHPPLRSFARRHCRGSGSVRTWRSDP